MVVAGAVVVLASALGGTAAYAYAGDVPRGTTVLGIDIGAMSRQQAEATLEAGLAQRAEVLAAPVDVRIGEGEPPVTAQVQPQEVGLTVDVSATVAKAATARHPIPALFGSEVVSPVVRVDPQRLDEALRDAAGKVGEAMTMPEIRFEGTEPVPVYPEPGLGLDPEVSAQALAAGWPPAEPAGQWLAPAAILVPLVEIDPVTTAADVDRLLEELAGPAVAAPVEVTTPDATFTVSPEAVAKSLRLNADEHGEIIPKVDRKALRKALADQLSQVETQPVDARFSLDSGEPRVLASSAGMLVDTEALAGELLAVLPEPAPRTVAASMTEVEAEVTEASLEELGIVERVSTFATYFDGGLGEPRSQNIVRVAELVDAAVVQPGEVFSLNDFTGPRGYAEGFVDAPVIVGGKLVPGVGGGISQFTTTLFNAAFYAGLEDVDHTPHSYWYSRYPSVIEATIFYPYLDMQFRNDTEYGVLIDTSYDSGSITVSMWSTRVWGEVTAEWGARRDVVTPKVEYLKPGPDCIATAGRDGFTQDAWRIFYRDGIEVKREKFSWRYDAEPQFRCEEKPD
jgi:vancomycin resistance protein YoaR